MSITLRRIRSFIVVAELGGFRRAADELSISQPALSAHIAELEAELGIVLFRRTTRQVRLTEMGEEFLARVKRPLGDLESLILEVKERAAVQRGRVIVAAVPSIAANVLPQILADFMAQHPGITAHISDDRAEVIELRVQRSEVDFAIGPAFDRRRDLEFEPVVDDPFLAIFPKAHPLARRRTVTLRDVAAYPMITMRLGQNMRRVLDQAADDAGLKLRPAHEVYHHDTLAGLIEAGLGVGAMPALTVSIVRQPSLAIARIVDPPIVRQIGLIKRRGETFSPAARKFAEAVRRHLVGLADKQLTRQPRARPGSRARDRSGSAGHKAG